MASSARRVADRGLGQGPFWFATITDPAHPHALPHLAMRTHPDAPHAGFVSALPPAALAALADALEARGEHVTAWNGDLESATTLCQRAAPGAQVVCDLRTRLFELSEVVWPLVPRGTIRPATAADDDLVVAWALVFHHDADVQGGREPHAPNEAETRRILGHRPVWFFEVDGEPVHMTGVTGPVGGVVRIGPVYTPAEHRGHGYAAHVVATLSQQALDQGLRPCLYTDQANPVSNKVYERIGYVASRDEGNVRALVA